MQPCNQLADFLPGFRPLPFRRRNDLLGCFALTDDAFRQMTRIAMDYADSCCEGRLVSLLEGGYNLDGTALAAAAHVETLLG